MAPQVALTRRKSAVEKSESTPLVAGNITTSDIESGGVSSFGTSQPSNPTPTWSEAFAYVSPYLKPRDKHHSLLAFLALLTVLLEKVGNSSIFRLYIYIFILWKTETDTFSIVSTCS